MNVQGTGSNMSAAALSAYADSKNEESVREDIKGSRTRRAQKMKSHVDAARTNIDMSKQAADQRLSSAKKKTMGGIMGFLIGLLIAVALVITAFTGGMAAPVAAAVIGLGVAALGAGSSVGGLIGGKTAEGNDEKAEELTVAADKAKVDEKELDKESEDLRDQLKDAQEARRQIYEDARSRERDRNRVLIG